MKVFVTGAGGFIGSHLCEALRDAGHSVTGMARYRSHDSFGWLDEVNGVNKVRGDVRDAEQMRAMIVGQDIVFHLAAFGSIPYSYDAPRTFVDTNVTGTLNVLLACKDAGAKLIHTSTSEVYGTAQVTRQDETHPINPQSPYAASKVGADALVKAFNLSYGVQAVILRPFNTYGPRQSARAVIPSIVRQMLDPKCRRIAVGDLTPKRDFTYVGDTVKAFMALAFCDHARPGEAYNAGSGRTGSIADTIKQLRTITGCDKLVEQTAIRVRPSESEVRALVSNSSKMVGTTHWTPKVSFEEGLKLTVDWWRGRTLNELPAVA